SNKTATEAYSYFSNFINSLLDAFVPLKTPKTNSGYPKHLGLLHDRIKIFHNIVPNCASTHSLRERFNRALKKFEFKRESNAINSVFSKVQTTPMVAPLPLSVPSTSSFDLPFITIAQILSAISQLVFKINGSLDNIPNFVYTKSYKIYIRPLLESSTIIWNPTAIGLTNKLESVQREFTKRVLKRSGLPYLSYPDRLECFLLETLEYRRATNDMFFVYDSVHGFVHLDTSDLYSISPLTR
ncbi:hypothetical protein PENTCL1PPCAC_26869, partial [Pristionchus entomophagus]